ncbi:hypothetical protein [Leucobacter sp. GX24907]
MTHHADARGTRTVLDSRLPLDTDARLQEVLGLLLGSADQRQTWLLVLGDDHRLLDPLIPIEGLTEGPDETEETDDLGTVTAARVLAERASMIRELLEGASLVLVWERVGSEGFTTSDRAWAKAMAHECQAHGPTLRAQFVLHDDGIRQITADDWG